MGRVSLCARVAPHIIKVTNRANVVLIVSAPASGGSERVDGDCPAACPGTIRPFLYEQTYPIVEPARKKYLGIVR